MEQDNWKAIAFAARYGHQEMLARFGLLTAEQLKKFNDALQYWIGKENENGSRMHHSIAEGGG